MGIIAGPESKMIINVSPFSYDMHSHIKETLQDRRQTVSNGGINLTRAGIGERAF